MVFDLLFGMQRAFQEVILEQTNETITIASQTEGTMTDILFETTYTTLPSKSIEEEHRRGLFVDKTNFRKGHRRTNWSL